jgi:hypothetical protein
VNLYHVQDGDRPMYVVAADWSDALRRWSAQIRKEDETMQPDEPVNPAGVALIAEGGDGYPELLLPGLEETT